MAGTDRRRARSPFKAGSRDRRYKEIVEHAAAKPWGTVHQLPFPFSETAAKTHANIIWAEARAQGLGRKVTVSRDDQGSYLLSFQLWDKASARMHIAEKARRGEPLAYNTLRRKET